MVNSNQKDKDANTHGVSGGEMSKRVHTLDWSKTPVGAMGNWPQSLKATIKTLLGSRYPMILLWGEELIQIYNDAYTGLIGDQHPEALGRSIRESLAESWDTIGPMIHEVMSTGVPNWVPAQMLAVNRSGYPEETYFSLSYSAVEDDKGIIKGMLCVCSEVTQQVRSERRLRLQRDLASKAGETRSIDKVCEDVATAISEHPWDVPFALLYLREADGTLTLRSTVGIDANSPTCIKHIDLKTDNPDPWSLELAITGETVSTKAVDQILSISGGPWNEPIQAALTLPIPSSVQNNPLGVLVAGINPNCALDESYSSFYELLAGQVSMALRNALAYEEERKRAEALAEIDRAKTAFFSNVSHEFRTPLTLMLGPLEETISEKNKSLSETDRDQLTTVYQNTLRLLKLMNTLLDFSRIEAKRAQASYEPIDLCFFTSELASAFQSAIEKAGLRYEVSCAPLSEPIYVDPEMWEKIVLNLTSNAFKFTFAGQITVALKETATHAKLTVQDTGVGIPQEELPNLFKRFHRIQNSRSRSYEGTGIGLALVKELVELHGGTIDVASVAGKGTTFTISIPKGTAHLDKERISAEKHAVSTAVRTEAYVNEAVLWTSGDAETELLTEEKIAASEGQLQSDKNIRVLLVDDNADMLQYLKRILSAYWNVEAVKDGIEALAAARRATPDLILSDVMMPNMNGFELLSEIRNDDSSIRHIPVILLSARAGEEASIEGLEKGANDYLVKPFSARELIARVRTQLEIKHTRQDNTRLREAEETLKTRNEELQKINNDLDNFIYTASHDLKSPVSNLEGLFNMLLSKIELDDKLLRLKVMIEASFARFKNTITALTEIAKVQKEDAEDLEVVKFSDTVEEVKSDIKEQIEKYDAQIQAEFTVEQIRFSRKNLRSILYNFITNAIKYSDLQRRPVVKIATEKEDDFVVLTIADNGLGIPLENQNKIFQMFKRLHDHVEGTGVGLYIVKRIVDNAGGKIEVESEEGKGTAFKVYFKE